MAVTVLQRRRDPFLDMWAHWCFLRWTVETGRAGPATVDKSVRSRSFRPRGFRGLVTLVGEQAGRCRRPEHASLPGHGARH